MEVLVEIYSYYKQQIEIARQVDWVYDFALPPLVLHTLFACNARALGEWLSMRPQNCVTVFAILLLPSLSLFVSVLYRTLNSEGIGFFRKPERGVRGNSVFHLRRGCSRSTGHGCD